MNLAQLNPLNWGRSGRKASPAGVNVTARESNAEGPYASMFNDWIAREVNPWLYEAIREAVAPIDGAINRLTTMDGIVRVEAATDRLQRTIDDFTESVQVNDMEHGLQAFYRSQSNEMYEQGCNIGEYILGEGKQGVIRLRVADSKGIYFTRVKNGPLEIWYKPPGQARGRRDGTDQVERVLRNSYQRATSIASNLAGAGYRSMDPSTLVYVGYNNEADNPYGVSLMRSTEFDARVLLTMKNALHQVWSRFGDPSFIVNLKTKARTPAEIDDRRKTIANNLAEVLNIKRQGNSADFVNAIGPSDELDIKVLGADGQVLEIEMPARHVLEQIVAKTGLPSWMLGFHWSTAERLAQRQGELVLQESKTRFEQRKPGLARIIAADLRGKGVTWNPGDFQLVQELPSLQDLLAEAQAEFLGAQTEMMRGGAAPGQGDAGGAGPKAAASFATVTASGEIKFPTDDMTGTNHHDKSHGKATCRHKAETYVEDEDALMRLENRASRSLQAAWDDLFDDVINTLGLDKAKSAKAPEPVFIFDQTMLAGLNDLQDAFIATAGSADGQLAASIYDAWLRGVGNATVEIGPAAVEVELAVREHMRGAMATLGMEQVKDTTVRALRDDIIKSLEDGVYNGQNPKDVARALKQRFTAHDYDWERLARSEIASAQSEGKITQYAASDIEKYNWVPAGDACQICMGLVAGGPYTVGAGPMPVRDSHPNDRCTVAAVVE